MPVTIDAAAARVVKRRQNTDSTSAGKFALAAIANARPTMYATFWPLNARPRPIETSPSTTVEIRATRSSSCGAACPRRTTLIHRSCDNAAAPASVRPATTARIVANATAVMKPRNTRPPTTSASSGAAMLPPGSTAVIAFCPTSTIAPNPRTNVSR